MSANEIAVIVFGCTFGGAMVGMFIAGRLPDHHLSSESRDVVRMAVGTVATLAALVIGLLIATEKGSFDTRDSELRQFSANLILLDRQLVHYGPEAQEARELLKRYASYKLDATWKTRASSSAKDPDGWMLLEDVQDRIRALTPASDGQRWLQSRALQISGDLAKTRWLLDVQTGSSIPGAFLVLLVFWLAAIFTSFGLLAPINTTVITALFVCALSVSGAIFLVVEMDEPFEGLIQISSEPMRDALAHLR
ncbi:MAG TPA: hypothetical protein VJY33_18250 [Isosphaeraceae bacterium]|nr:hypothetical protein [Isosphaeraceae bacterium]